MECKRCGGTDHPNATWVLCPKNHIARKLLSWDPNSLSNCTINDGVLAGLIDADGHVQVHQYGTVIGISQSHEWGLHGLELIQLYEGSGCLSGPSRDEEYVLNWTGKDVLAMQLLMERFGVKKGPSFAPERITDDWLGGFFAGDGCARRTALGYPNVHITQNSSPALIRAIKDYLGFGSVTKDGRRWYCNGANARYFATRFRHLTLWKYSDLSLLL